MGEEFKIVCLECGNEMIMKQGKKCILTTNDDIIKIYDSGSYEIEGIEIACKCGNCIGEWLG